MVAGCTHAIPYRLAKKQEVYTLTNLHPDPARKRLYSVNYQQAGLIPVCTPVRIEQVTRAAMTFTRLDTDKRYQYLFHDSTPDSPTTHLDKYFGEECPKQKMQKLGAKDQKGIDSGKVLEGMTKQGVVFAIGYPPAHRTPSLDSDVWTYWKNRWATFEVHFKDGRVSKIQR
jgi:hypothetical protein